MSNTPIQPNRNPDAVDPRLIGTRPRGSAIPDAVFAVLILMTTVLLIMAVLA